MYTLVCKMTGITESFDSSEAMVDHIKMIYRTPMKIEQVESGDYELGLDLKRCLFPTGERFIATEYLYHIGWTNENTLSKKFFASLLRCPNFFEEYYIISKRYEIVSFAGFSEEIVESNMTRILDHPKWDGSVTCFPPNLFQTAENLSLLERSERWGGSVKFLWTVMREYPSLLVKTLTASPRWDGRLWGLHRDREALSVAVNNPRWDGDCSSFTFTESIIDVITEAPGWDGISINFPYLFNVQNVLYVIRSPNWIGDALDFSPSLFRDENFVLQLLKTSYFIGESDENSLHLDERVPVTPRIREALVNDPRWDGNFSSLVAPDLTYHRAYRHPSDISTVHNLGDTSPEYYSPQENTDIHNEVVRASRWKRTRWLVRWITLNSFAALQIAHSEHWDGELSLFREVDLDVLLRIIRSPRWNGKLRGSLKKSTLRNKWFIAEANRTINSRQQTTQRFWYSSTAFRT